MSVVELCDVALCSTCEPLLRVSLSRYHDMEAPSHASILVTRSSCGTLSVFLVPLSVEQPPVGCGVRVTPSPRMFTSKMAPLEVRPSSTPVTREVVEASGM